MKRIGMILQMGQALRILLSVSTIIGLFAGAVDAQLRHPLQGQPLERPARLLLQPGPPPTGVQIVARTQTTATLTWQAAPGATGYSISRRGGTPIRTVTVTPTPINLTSFKDSGLTPGKSYSWTVMAIHPGKNPGESALVTTNTLPPVSSSEFGFQAKATGLGEVTLSWSSVPEVAFYWLQGSGLSAREVSGTSYKVSGLNSGTHDYSIMAHYIRDSSDEDPALTLAKTSVIIGCGAQGNVVGDAERDFGGGKHGKAHAALNCSSGVLNVMTETWTNSPFQGFTVGMKVWVVDPLDILILDPEGESYGVNGTWVPGAPSQRIDPYHVQLEPTKAAQAARIYVLLFHAPKIRIAEIVSQAGQETKKVSDAINSFCQLNPDVCDMARDGLRAAGASF